MKRTIVSEGRHRSQEISPGIWVESFYPGGLRGPNDECLLPTPGGQGFTDVIYVGEDTDPFQIMLPDIRMPANQYWPLHWHDCWTVVVLVEGSCCIGDWWMEPSDVFMTVPSLEYGPLVSGPTGCRLFEIFAQAHLAAGGYAPEYHDHPTLQGSSKVFLERSEVNRRNIGNQVLPCDGVEGIWKSRLQLGAVWDMGDPGDPDRAVMRDTRLAKGERVEPARYDDWHLIMVLDGSLEIAGQTVGPDDFIRIARGAERPAMQAGVSGAQLLELSRTARAAQDKLAAGAAPA